MTEFSLAAQIAEVEREIKMRRDVYARQVANGKMRQSIADYHIGAMEAVLETLRQLELMIESTETGPGVA